MKNIALFLISIFTLSSCSDTEHEYHQFGIETHFENGIADFNTANQLFISLSEHTSGREDQFEIKFELVERESTSVTIFNSASQLNFNEFYPIQKGESLFEINSTPGINKMVIHLMNVSTGEIKMKTVQFATAPEGDYFLALAEKVFRPYTPVNIYFNNPQTIGNNKIWFESQMPVSDFHIEYNNIKYNAGDKIDINNMKSFKLNFYGGHRNLWPDDLVFKIQTSEGTIFTTPILRKLTYEHY